MRRLFFKNILSRLSRNGGSTIAIVNQNGVGFSLGSGSFGALGNNDTADATSPISIAGSINFSKIDFGFNHATGLNLNTSRAYTWGDNTYGQLGDNTTTSRSSPVAVVGSKTFIDVSTGTNVSAGIDKDGNAWTWGSATTGVLGSGDANNNLILLNPQSSPVSVTLGRSFNKVMTSSETSNDYVAVEASTGNLYAWGINSNGQLGDGTTTSRSSPVSVLGGRSYSFLHTGYTFNLAIEGSTGNLYAWGFNPSGQLGDGTSANRSSPVSVLGGRSYNFVTSDTRNTVYAIEASTSLIYAWGNNTIYGMIGDGTLINKSSPVSVIGNRSYSYVAAILTAGGVDNYAVAIEKNTGKLYSWGANSSGALGDGTAAIRSSPVSVLGGRSYSSIVVQGGVTSSNVRVLAIEGSTGNIYAWGNNTSGALGDGTVTSRSSPVSVLGNRRFSKIIDTQKNGTSVNAIEALTGNIYAWGNNTSGALGDGTVTSRSSPVSVLGGRGYSSTASCGNASGISFFAIDKSTGILYSWGYNLTYGQLGDGTTTNRSSPVAVLGGRSYSNVFAGSQGTAISAIEGATGLVYTWGNNAQGQLGASNVIDTSSPVSVIGGLKFKNISVGQQNIAGLTNDGYAYVWGDNTCGQIGQATIAISAVNSPVSVFGNRKFKQVHLNCPATLGQTTVGALVASTGLAYMWGYGGPMLGNNTAAATSTSSAVSVFGARNFKKLLVGTNFVTAIENSTGYIWSWGNNSYGQLGDGTITTRSSPVSMLGARSYSDIGIFDYGVVAIEASTSKIFVTGNINSLGWVGTNYVTNSTSPLSSATSRSYKDISFGSSLLALDSSGVAYSWGHNVLGEIGDGTTNNQSSPVSVVGGRVFSKIGGIKNLASVSSGDTKIAIESSTGYLYSWGNGPVGDGTISDRSSPTSVLGGRSYSYITDNVGDCFAIEGSTGYIWGCISMQNNTYGNLGDGTTTNRSSPVSVLGNRSFSYVTGAPYANAFYATYAIEASTGNAYSWGYNAYGNLGDGTAFNRSSPVSVLGNRSFKNIYCSVYDQVAALDGDGRAWTWGNNSALSGALGDGTFGNPGNRSSPVSVVGGKSFSKMAVGFYAMAGIESSTGYIYTWGLNTNGQLGDGTTTNRNSPVSILNNRSYSDVAFVGRVAADSVFAIEASTGYVYNWGDNSSGQLGDGTFISRSSPVKVLGNRSYTKVFPKYTNADYATAAIEGSTGYVYVWGSNNWGQLGVNTDGASYVTSPIQIFNIPNL